MLKTIQHPVTGQTFKMGRRMPSPQRPKLFFRDYLRKDALPEVPLEFDFSGPAKACLAQVLLNDSLGDCTAAGAFHLLGLFLACNGNPVTWTDAQVQTFYSLTTGYVPGNEATDQGGDEVTVLDFWRDKGIDGQGTHRIAAHVSVNALDVTEVRAAAYMLLGVYFGISLPDAWINPMPANDGFVWDVAGDADPDNGHCFVCPAAVTEDGLVIDTWGMRGLITWRAIQKYAVASAGGELHAVVSNEAIISATQKGPNAISFAEMMADAQALAAA